MLDGINALFTAVRYIFESFFEMPFYDSVSWGMLITAVLVMCILISFFVSRMK